MLDSRKPMRHTHLGAERILLAKIRRTFSGEKQIRPIGP
ncbi:hypothetical protein SAMN05216288_3967 [Pseudomonas punonensis]|uniref:Uncharacterized protein n=1 Tax=Phytopseudomonas punonensis TaxID=1220495 RepID=A0A1M7K6L4_9GAMM|nr:hypothetical protein SAMN05216288_3967 [Pseudomonas punonensis]